LIGSGLRRWVARTPTDSAETAWCVSQLAAGKKGAADCKNAPADSPRVMRG
jgi:hypothetical protein